MSLVLSLLVKGPLIFLATFVMGTVNLIVSLFDPDGRKQIVLARKWARMLLRIAGVRVEVEGLEKIAHDGSYVFAANHRSYMDTPVVLAFIPVQFRFLAKEGLFRIPFLGQHLKRAGHIPVPREDPRAAVKTMSEAGRVIRERGVSLLVFPEAGRTEGSLEPFKEGAAYIAIKAGAPIVPIGLIGTREILPIHSMNLRGGRVRLRIGEPISTAGLVLHDRGRVTAELYQRVAELLGQAPAVASQSKPN
jgi:1-acyl-sn-glycerol-3-phosphate acyltransferase